MLDEIAKFNEYGRLEFVVSGFVVSGSATENGKSYAAVRIGDSPQYDRI